MLVRGMVGGARGAAAGALRALRAPVAKPGCHDAVFPGLSRRITICVAWKGIWWVRGVRVARSCTCGTRAVRARSTCVGAGAAPGALDSSGGPWRENPKSVSLALSSSQARAARALALDAARLVDDCGHDSRCHHLGLGPCHLALRPVAASAAASVPMLHWHRAAVPPVRAAGSTAAQRPSPCRRARRFRRALACRLPLSRLVQVQVAL